MIAVYAKNIIKEIYIEKFMSLAKPLIEETRKETGNVSYELVRVLGKVNEFAFLEKWENNEVLEAHMKTKHFTTLIPQIGELLEEDMSISINEVII